MEMLALPSWCLGGGCPLGRPGRCHNYLLTNISPKAVSWYLDNGRIINARGRILVIKKVYPRIISVSDKYINGREVHD